MGSKVDRTGLRYSNLTVVRETERRSSSGAVFWLCECDCGNQIEVSGSNLASGNTKACGCLRTTHGLTGAPEHQAWKHIWDRCHNVNSSGYHKYGARGIYVCPEWGTFEQFYADMGPRPGVEYSIERIDNDGPYSPENCRWATVKEQNNNRRSTRWVEAFGETLSLANAVGRWGTPLGLSYSVVQARMNRGMSAESALTTPLMRDYSNRKVPKQRQPLNVVQFQDQAG